MKIKVGLIGSRQTVSKLEDIAKNYSQLDIVATPFVDEYESESLLRNIAGSIDIVVFTGPVPYILAKQLVDELKIPYFYVPFDELAVLSTLMSLSINKQKKLERFSIDLPETRHAVEIFNEISLPMNQIYIIDYLKEFDWDKLFEYHYGLYTTGKIDYAVTSRVNVYNKLELQGVPCFRLMPPLKSLRDVIKLVNLKSETLLLDLARFAVVNVGQNKHDTHWITERDEEINLKLYQVLTGFSKLLGGSISTKSGFVTIYTDRKKLEKFTKNFTKFPFVHELKKSVHNDFSVGIGLGWTNHDAEKHAMIALREASSQKGDHVYLVTENMEVTRPVYSQNDYVLKTDNKDLLRIANETNLSIATVSKIKFFLETAKKNSVSSEELANALGITRRSAQRILKVLVDSKLARVVGEEQPYKKGRPITLYSILF